MSKAEIIYTALFLFGFFLIVFGTFKLSNKLLKLKLENMTILQAAGLTIAVSLMPSPLSEVGILLIPLIPVAFKVSGKQLLFFAMLNSAFGFLWLLIISFSIMGGIVTGIKLIFS